MKSEKKAEVVQNETKWENAVRVMCNIFLPLDLAMIVINYYHSPYFFVETQSCLQMKVPKSLGIIYGVQDRFYVTCHYAGHPTMIHVFNDVGEKLGFFNEYKFAGRIEHIIAEDDRVFAMLNTKATSKLNDKTVTIKSADLYTISDDMIVEHWDVVEATEFPNRRISEL